MHQDLYFVENSQKYTNGENTVQYINGFLFEHSSVDVQHGNCDFGESKHLSV